MEQRICLFLDLLGFKGCVSDLHHHPHRIVRILQLLNDMRSFGANTLWAREADFIATQFSDSLVISFVPIAQGPNDNLLPQYSLVQNLQHLLMSITRNGFLVRGGAAIGPLHHSQQQLFGQALIEAYELENEANYPRVLFTPEAKAAIVNGITGERAHEADMLFSRGRAGIISMDYIRYGSITWWMRPSTTDEEVLLFYSALRERLHEMQQSKSLSVKDKFEWAVTLYEAAIDSLVGTPSREPNLREHRWTNKFAELRDLTI